MKDIQFGRIKMFDIKKGFGFIKPDNGGPDIFFRVEAGDLLKVVDGKIVFADEREYFLDYYSTDLAIPRINEPVVFSVAKGKQGRPKVHRWCYQYMLSEVNAYLFRSKYPKSENVSIWMFMSACDNCKHISSFYGKGYESCHCYNNPDDEESTEPLEVVTLSDGRQGIVVNDYTETNLGDTPGGFHVIE